MGGCQAPAQGANQGGGSGPFVVTGRVTTAAGAPVVGAQMFADGFLYDDNELAVTDANGLYRLTLPQYGLEPYRIGGHVNATYHGVKYRLSLHPLNPQHVVASEGGVRDFEWRLTGPVDEDDPYLYYGEDVWVMEYDFGSSIWIDDVELTFTPLQPLIDGSAGEALARRPEGGKVADVAVGYYRVSARLLSEGEEPTDLLIRVRDVGVLAEATTATFVDKPTAGLIMELEVALALP